MSWDDIDFDLIVPGMITRGPATVSFAEYLQQFARALDERLNMVTGDFVEFPLPNIEFQAGEIRNEVFIDKFKFLITEYARLWNGFSSRRADFQYYSKEVLTDPENFPDYLLTGADLETAMGAEAWEIFSLSPFQMAAASLTDIFKASILQGLFIVYEFTNIKRTSANTTATRNIPFNLNTAAIGFEAAAIPAVFGRSYAATLALLNWVPTQLPLSTSTIAFYGFTVENRGLLFGYSIHGLGLIKTKPLIQSNGFDVLLECRDLEGNLLEMDYNSASTLGRNSFVNSATNQPTPPFTSTITTTKYNEDFPLIVGTGDDILINTPIDSITQTPDGTKQLYKVSGNSPFDSLPLINEALVFDNTQRLEISAPGEHFIDLNNPALEFFIDNS